MAWGIPVVDVAIPQQTTTNATPLSVVFTSPPTRDDVAVDLGTASRITLPATAYFRHQMLIGCAELEFLTASSTGARTVTVNHKDSVGVVRNTFVMDLPAPSTATVVMVIPFAALSLAAGDYLELIATQASTANMDVLGKVVFALIPANRLGLKIVGVSTSPGSGTQAFDTWAAPATDGGPWYDPADTAASPTGSNLQTRPTVLKTTAFWAVCHGTFAANATGVRRAHFSTAGPRALNGLLARDAGAATQITSGAVHCILAASTGVAAFLQRSGGALACSANLWLVPLPRHAVLFGISGAGAGGTTATGVTQTFSIPLPTGAAQNDLGGFLDAAQPTRLTFRLGGSYAVHATVGYALNATAARYRDARIVHKNSAGATLRTIIHRERNVVTTDSTQVVATAILYGVVAGDYLEIQAIQDSGATIVVNLDELGIARLGP